MTWIAVKTSIIIFCAKYLYVAVLAIAFLFFLKQPKEIKKKILVFGAVVLPMSYFLAKLSSLFFYDPRPFVQGNFTPLIPHAADNGFPSDHTLLSAALSAVIFPFGKKTSFVLWFLTVLVGLSRVFSGIHHFVDILGSIAVSAVVGYMVYFVSMHKRRVFAIINLWKKT